MLKVIDKGRDLARVVIEDTDQDYESSRMSLFSMIKDDSDPRASSMLRASQSGARMSMRSMNRGSRVLSIR